MPCINTPNRDNITYPYILGTNEQVIYPMGIIGSPLSIKSRLSRLALRVSRSREYSLIFNNALQLPYRDKSVRGATSYSPQVLAYEPQRT